MATITGNISFQVPDGYVFVARACSLVPDIAINDGDGLIIVPTITFFINRVSVNQMANLRIDLSATPVPPPLFFIAPPSAVITIQIEYDTGAISPQPTINVTANLIGNFILSNGSPSNLAVANPKTAIGGSRGAKLAR